MLRIRDLTAKEEEAIKRLSQSRTAPARVVERAKIVSLAYQGEKAPAIAAQLRLGGDTVRLWIKRFNAKGVDGLADEPRAGRPATYTAEEIGTVIATSLSNPKSLGLPFASWTLDRLEAHLNEEKGIAILTLEKGHGADVGTTGLGVEVNVGLGVVAAHGEVERPTFLGGSVTKVRTGLCFRQQSNAA